MHYAYMQRLHLDEFWTSFILIPTYHYLFYAYMNMPNTNILLNNSTICVLVFFILWFPALFLRLRLFGALSAARLCFCFCDSFIDLHTIIPWQITRRVD